MKVTDQADQPADLRRVIGGNVRRIRNEHGVSLEAFAREAKRNGLPYSTGRVSDLEGGRVEAKIEVVVAWAQVLANLTDRPVTLAELLEGDPRAQFFQGQPVTPDEQSDASELEIARRLGWPELADAAAAFEVPINKVTPYLVAMDESGLAEKRAARRLGTDLVTFTRHSVQLWGRNLSAERDRVAGEDASTARLGQVTSELVEQIRERL